MLNADCSPYFDTCPRCGDGGLQRFSTHSYCVGCNYSDSYAEGDNLSIPKWALDALANEKKNKKPKLALILNQKLRSSLNISPPRSIYEIPEEAS